MKYLISPNGKRKINTLGFTIPLKYRTVNDFGEYQSLATTDIRRIRKGFSIHRFSSYVSTENIRIEVMENGTMKAKGVYDKNYQPKVYFTEYFNKNGVEITQKEFKVLNK